MTTAELDTKAAELRELQTLIDDLTAQADAIRDTFKSAMIDAGQDEISGTGWKASWKAVTSTRLDSKVLKAADPDTFARFARTSTVCRFCFT